MGKWIRYAGSIRIRDLLLWLMLISHTMVTFGFPMPVPGHSKSHGGIPFPCQSRPCGCLTSEQCWKGDCCCFSLEEKLSWAVANGIEPPNHVRPLVESRRTRSMPVKSKSCCTDRETGRPAKAGLACCESVKDSATNAGIGHLSCEVEATKNCNVSAAKAISHCCDKTESPRSHDESGIRWVVGIFAQKCRGDGPAGFYQIDPALVTDPSIPLPILIQSDSFAHPESEQTVTLLATPPTPPPELH